MPGGVKIWQQITHVSPSDTGGWRGRAHGLENLFSPRHNGHPSSHWGLRYGKTAPPAAIINPQMILPMAKKSQSPCVGAGERGGAAGLGKSRKFEICVKIYPRPKGFSKTRRLLRGLGLGRQRGPENVSAFARIRTDYRSCHREMTTRLRRVAATNHARADGYNIHVPPRKIGGPSACRLRTHARRRRRDRRQRIRPSKDRAAVPGKILPAGRRRRKSDGERLPADGVGPVGF
jgi:hypothetical protein